MGGAGEYQDFPSKILCFTVPKFVVGVHFRVSLISGIKNFMFQKFRSLFSIFCRTFFCLTMLKISVGGNPLVFH